MLNPRWRKVLSDIQQNVGRVGLTVGAIAVGVFSITWVSATYSILSRELHNNYVATNPASAILYTDNAAPELVQAVENLPNITQAEAMGMVSGRAWVKNEWKTLELFVRPDFQHTRINELVPEKGAYPPPVGEIVLERLALSVADAEIGDSLLIQIPGQPQKAMQVAGTLHDVNLAPAWQEGMVYGYVTADTLNQLGITPKLDEIRIVVSGDASNEQHIREVTTQTARWLESHGQPIYRVQVPPPNEHPLQNQMNAALLLLAALGAMALLLSAVLIANTIAAFLAQQIRQIAVMKAIGGRGRQIIGMYVGMILSLSGMAAIIGLPLGLLAGRGVANFMAFMLNFNIESYRVPHPVILLQLTAGLVIPLLATAYPIYRGTQFTVREALNDYGVSRSIFGENWLDRLLVRLNGLTRPFLLSVRNTFRRRVRLIFTLSTLAVGGAVFMAALNVRASLLKTIDLRYEGLHYDLSLAFNQPYPVEELEKTAASVSGVASCESWGRGTAAIVGKDGTAGNAFIVLAPPVDTKLITPMLIEGEWLSQENGIVLNHNLLAEYPDVELGDEITLSINNQLNTWHIIGFVREPVAPPLAYVTYGDFARATGETGYAQSLYLVTEQHDKSSLQSIKQNLEKAFANNNLAITTNQNSFERRQIMENHAALITSFLLLATLMSTVVGGLGLMTTMSINILERTREIGIMRAVGASNAALLKIILLEAMLIGFLSWVMATVLATPISYVLAQMLGKTMLKTPLDFAISPLGFVLWFGAVMLFSITASLPPAWNATRLTVRDVITYE
ncbi:MAG: FtsX-like permease family protein [Chloroflexi bacterium]|nr:FtsX-like permease family protein [Chloroflexota bacterium]